MCKLTMEQVIEALHSAQKPTCVVLKNNRLIFSHERGIRPIIDWLEQDDTLLNNALIADKVIGRAAALLFVYGGVREVYTDVMSAYAREIFESNGIGAQYAKLVPFIVNRAGDGMCPMEQSVLTISSPEEAFEVLKNKVSKR